MHRASSKARRVTSAPPVRRVIPVRRVKRAPLVQLVLPERQALSPVRREIRERMALPVQPGLKVILARRERPDLRAPLELPAQLDRLAQKEIPENLAEQVRQGMTAPQAQPVPRETPARMEPPARLDRGGKPARPDPLVQMDLLGPLEQMDQQGRPARVEFRDRLDPRAPQGLKAPLVRTVR